MSSTIERRLDANEHLAIYVVAEVLYYEIRDNDDNLTARWSSLEKLREEFRLQTERAERRKTTP